MIPTIKNETNPRTHYVLRSSILRTEQYNISKQAIKQASNNYSRRTTFLLERDMQYGSSSSNNNNTQKNNHSVSTRGNFAQCQYFEKQQGRRNFRLWDHRCGRRRVGTGRYSPRGGQADCSIGAIIIITIIIESNNNKNSSTA